MNRILISTKNSGKLKEFQSILNDMNMEFIALNDYPNFPDIEETGDSFEENAILKAIETYKILQIPVIADDSGLSVDCLGGDPGVYSARYANKNCNNTKQNIKKLINNLRLHPKPYTAKYECIIAYYDGNALLTSYGQCNGRMVLTPRGSNGFAYDSIFIPDGYNKTMAELDSEIKNKISHRFIALNEMNKKLKELK